MSQRHYRIFYCLSMTRTWLSDLITLSVIKTYKLVLNEVFYLFLICTMLIYLHLPGGSIFHTWNTKNWIIKITNKMQFAKKSKNIYSYAFLIMMYVQMIVYQVWPYQFFPGKYIWVFYFPSFDLIISVFFIQLYKINFFHIVFVIHIVVIIFGTWRFVVFIGI